MRAAYPPYLPHQLSLSCYRCREHAYSFDFITSSNFLLFELSSPSWHCPPTMTSTAAPGDGDQNRGPSLIAIFWVESAVASAVILLRVSGRIMIRKFGPDDYMMLFTLVR